MKKIVLLSAAALLLAGCAAPASSANTAPSASPAATAASTASSPAADPTASTVASDSASSPAATTSSAMASPAVKLSTADTCAAITAVMKANQPAAGSSDSKQYWVTLSDQIHPIAEKASDEMKPSVDGLFTYFDTRAKSWGTQITKEQGAQGTQAFDGISKFCKPATK